MSFSLWLIFESFVSFSLLAHRATSASHVLERRDPALVTSPSGNYAPVYVPCPQDLFLRAPSKQIDGKTELSKPEQIFINEKAQKSLPLWRHYLETVGLKDFDLREFLSKAEERGGSAGDTLPNIGFALSGGGGRALCLSAAILEAFDSRNPSANDASIGGVLQLANYAVGVSGSSWLLGSWATSNFEPISTLSPSWRLSEENDLWDWNVAKHYRKIYKAIKKKKKAGFYISIVDFWGRLLSRLFINDPTQSDPNQGVGVLWSSIRETPRYKAREAPYVIAVTTSRPGTKQDFTPDSPIYEFSAEEFGVFHPHLNASIAMEYLGSLRPNLLQPGTCVRGYDNAGFVMGMSSNIYSLIDAPRKKSVVLKIIDKLTDDDNFEGKVPNTFRNLAQEPHDGSPPFQDNQRDTILMADCGFIAESIPIYPLIQPERRIDVIMAVDASTDGKNINPHSKTYPNGTALFMSYRRTQLPQYHGYHMPKIPNAFDGSFVNASYHRRPTFFGCNELEAPIIIYFPNYYAVGETNVPTAKTTFTPEDVEKFYKNGFAIASQNAGPTKNKEWPACLACAIIDRQVTRNGAKRTPQCQACFQQYCAAE